MNNKPYCPFLKTLLSLFINCQLALRSRDQFSRDKTGNSDGTHRGSPLFWVLRPPGVNCGWISAEVLVSEAGGGLGDSSQLCWGKINSGKLPLSLYEAQTGPPAVWMTLGGKERESKSPDALAKAWVSLWDYTSWYPGAWKGGFGNDTLRAEISGWKRLGKLEIC
jgi:hypothetical protein